MSKMAKLRSLQKPTSSSWQTTGSILPWQVFVVVVAVVVVDLVVVVNVVVVKVVVVSVPVSVAVVDVPVVAVVDEVSMHVLHMTLHLSRTSRA